MHRPNRILAVDDNPLNLEILSEILGDACQLECATNGEEAIRVATALRPDVVLLDVMMPGMDGLTTCRRLRSIPGLRDTLIVMISAKAMESERKAGLAAGADEYITKPFDEETILGLVTSNGNSKRA